MRRIDIIFTLVEEATGRRIDRDKFEIEFLAQARNKAHFLETIPEDKAADLLRECREKEMDGIRAWAARGAIEFLRDPPQPNGKN